MQTVREAAVSGSFYPANPTELAATVDKHLEQLAAPVDHSRLIIAPHAGYEYSGRFAGIAYRALDPAVNRVLILGPTHHVGIEGMALSGADLHATPLGIIPADVELTELLENLPGVITAPIVQAREHSLEVQLPFLQRVLNEFTVVPLAVGMAAPAEVARTIETALSLPNTAVIVSSDLSHYLTAEQARGMDTATVQQILQLQGELTGEQACGMYPVNGLMQFARQHGWRGKLLSVGNSADTSGARARVVGYPALSWYPPGREVDALQHARNTIEHILAEGNAPAPNPSPSLDRSASFVTITLAGQLRGCIGNLKANGSLMEDVARNARLAAFSDPRFPPLTPGEWEIAEIEVSLLSEPEYLYGTPLSERDAIAMLVPGVHGVVWESDLGSATFLPQVWKDLPIGELFLSELKKKAGVDPDYWGDDVRLKVYTVTSLKGPALVEDVGVESR